jgi:hypothetical protein
LRMHMVIPVYFLYKFRYQNSDNLHQFITLDKKAFIPIE